MEFNKTFHKPLEQVLKEAEESWKNDHIGKEDEFERYKIYFIFGWLRSSYNSLYEDFSDQKIKTRS